MHTTPVICLSLCLADPEAIHRQLAQDMKFDEAWFLGDIALPVQPDGFEIGLRTPFDAEPVHGDEHGDLLTSNIHAAVKAPGAAVSKPSGPHSRRRA